MNTDISNGTYDDKAWQLLNENRLNWSGHDEKEDTVWPCNRKEIRATKKVFKSIDYNQLTHQTVIDEYEAQKELTATIKKELPNNRLKMILPLTIVLSAVFFYLWYAYPPVENNFTPQDWVVTVPTEIVNSSARKPNIELSRKNVAKGTAVIPLGRGEQKHIKVELPSGETGFIHVAAFSGVNRNSEIVNGTQLYSVSNRKKTIGNIENDIPKIIGVPKPDEENNRQLKVRTSNGRIGYIFDNHIKYHFDDSIPKLNSDYVLPVASTKAEEWKGQTIAAVEERYGPVSSYIDNKGYWNNIRIIGDTVAYQGVIAQVNQEGIIETVQFGKQEGLFGAMSFYPVWRMIASLEPFYGKIDLHYKQTDRELNIGWWQKLRSSHWSLRAVTWIIVIVLKILWFILKVSVLFLPVIAIGIIVSHLERVSYRLAYKIVTWLLLLVLLYMAAFTLLQDKFQIIGFIIFLIAAFANFIGFLGHLNKKCYNCGNWHGEITEKTDFLGQSVSVKYGARNKYVGSDTKQTGVTDSINTNTKTYYYKTTHRYQKVKTKDTSLYDNYEDHKMCKYCGIRWKESYKILKGEKHQEL